MCVSQRKYVDHLREEMQPHLNFRFHCLAACPRDVDPAKQLPLILRLEETETVLATCGVEKRLYHRVHHQCYHKRVALQERQALCLLLFLCSPRRCHSTVQIGLRLFAVWLRQALTFCTLIVSILLFVQFRHSDRVTVFNN